MNITEQIDAYKALRENGQVILIDDYEDADRIIESLMKQSPMKPILKERRRIMHVNKGNLPHEWVDETYMDWCCPMCDGGVGERFMPRTHDQQKLDYCCKCGQRIDWRGEK